MAAMFPAPLMPDLPDDRKTVAEGHLRYEDLAMDGRLMPLALPAQMGGLWRGLLSRNAGARASQLAGIVPLLTRLTLSTTAQHVRLDRPVESRGGYQLAHARDEAGAPNRIFMNLWCDVYGATGRLFPPEPAGPLALAGQMFAEHTFTRPFAAPSDRKVIALPPPFEPVPEAHYPLRPPVGAGEAPDGARYTTELEPDGMDLVFTLDQTDSNQHVNSLVYIRVFLEAAQRALGKHGAKLRVRSREVDIAYRKPCFAGDKIRVWTRLFEHPDGMGVAGQIVGDDDKPRCYVRTVFSA